MSEFKIQGVSIGEAKVKPIRSGVDLNHVKQALKKDGLDQVVFSQSDKLYVAYGRNLNIPAEWRGDFMRPSVEALREEVDPKATLDGKAVRLEWVNDEATSFVEGVKLRENAAGAALGVGLAIGIPGGPGGLVIGTAVIGAPIALGILLKGGLSGAMRRPNESAVNSITD